MLGLIELLLVFAVVIGLSILEVRNVRLGRVAPPPPEGPPTDTAA